MVTAQELPRLVNGCVRLPEIPERNPDEVTTYDFLHHDGNAFHLRQCLVARGADPETLLMTADHWIVHDVARFPIHSRYPDLMVAFDVDLELHQASNGYLIADQGKPPDFILEVASPSTGRIDVGSKRDDYELFGVREYWRFDDSGASHGARLGGDRLIDGRFEPIEIEVLDDANFQGYSEVLDVHLRWQNGHLGWFDPSTGQHIPTFFDQQAHAESERARAEAAEARLKSAEAELQRLRED